AARTTCNNNLKQIGVAIHDYASVYQDKLPMANQRDANNVNANGGLNINGALLPYIEQDNLFKLWQAAAPTGVSFWDAPAPSTPSGTMRTATIKVFQCPADPSMTGGYSAYQINAWGGSSYAANFQVFGRAPLPSKFGGTNWAPPFNVANIPDGT